jgi:hypothetical protein
VTDPQSQDAALTTVFSAPVQIQPAELAGRWFFCDDGWLGKLTLSADLNRQLAGSFYSERFGEDYRVTGQVGADGPSAVELLFHDFNWLPYQRFAGYLLTRGRNALSGHSMWQETPFGFFATRSARELLGTYRAGMAKASDFAGSWTVSLDGERATMDLEHDEPTGALHGSCTMRAVGERWDVVGRPDARVPHAASLSMSRPGIDQPVVEMMGYLMSRPKNAISGTLSTAGVTRGFIMTRFA